MSDLRLFVVETCHEGTDMCVRRATPEEVTNEESTHDGWAMTLSDARDLAKQTVSEFNKEPGHHRMRWFDFSEEP